MYQLNFLLNHNRFIFFVLIFFSYLNINAQWIEETSGGSTGYFNSVRHNASGDVYVILQDANNGYKATVQKKNGASWQVVGAAGFSNFMVIQPLRSIMFQSNLTKFY